MLRDSVVAGMFYEADAPVLTEHINKYIPENTLKTDAKAVIVPHAGYVYSGRVAVETLCGVNVPDTIIIMGPNHTGMGAPVSVMKKGEWRTPLGDIIINEPLADEIIKTSIAAEADTMAHAKEHSIEVQLPILQVLKGSFNFVPIILAEPNLKVLKDLGASICEASKDKKVLIIASTDLTHYESADNARKKDKMVLDAIKHMDEEEMYKAVKEYDISMCGWMPAYTAIYAAKIMGAKKAEIIKYMNSGDTSGDYNEVVGYGGAVIE